MSDKIKPISPRNKELDEIMKVACTFCNHPIKECWTGRCKILDDYSLENVVIDKDKAKTALDNCDLNVDNFNREPSFLYGEDINALVKAIIKEKPIKLKE